MSDAAIAPPPPAVPEPQGLLKKPWFRLVLLALGIAGLVVFVRAMGWTDDLSVEKVKSIVEAAGVWGMLLYIVIFCIGELAQLPGMLFVLAGLLAYGRVEGFFLAYTGAVASTLVAFLLVRAVGGTALGEIKWAFARKVLSRVEAQPIRIIFVLRLVLWIAPPLNAALALTKVRFVDYFIGTAAGLALPILAATLFFDRLLAMFTS